jgi:CRP/FNR family cyclic AMP-dependent transcriptional regulator
MLLTRRSEKIDLLRKVPLFSGLGRRHLEMIARAADEVKVDKGTVLVRQEELGREFLLIVDGTARVERDGQVINRLKAGDLCGEMSLIDGKPRCATVIAETPAVLLVVHRRSFGHLLNTVPGLQKKVLAGLCERLRTADAALASIN